MGSMETIYVHLPSAVGDECEFKTSGVCMVAPSVHPSGVIYRIVHDVVARNTSNPQSRPRRSDASPRGIVSPSSTTYV